ncbi:cell wall protein, partial [Enterococcus villorum]
KPDTSKVGKQDVKVSVKDETGRSEEVTFPITVKELLSIKKATDEIYQYDAVPDVKNYFDVTTEGTYTLQWANNPSTSTPGTYTWQATVNTSDGRTETKAMTMKILPYPDLLVKLKPVEDRTFTLGDSSDLLADHFKDYIDEVRMNGEKVDLNDLQLVAEESTKTIFQAIGQQELKLTVQAKHPVSNVMIKGTGTTTVNVNWGNTILVRTADGKSSAGAFTLRVGNTNNTTPTLSLYQGIASPLNEGVGDLTKPYDLYYNFEVLRNGRSVYNQDVTNRATLQEIMDRFGNANNTIDVQMDDIIKIYYPQKLANGSVVMVNEQEKDYTYGSEYAYYKVTPYGFDPAPVMEAESASKDFVLGEDSSQINPKDLVKNVTINGAVADDAFYTVENLSDFDTKTVGRRTMKVKITTNDGLASKEVEVSYNVKWGSTFVVKGLNDATAGAFSLLKNKDQWQLQASQGVEGTDLDNPVDNNFGYDTYYSIEVLRASTSQFLYEVAGNQSIRESINGFNNGQPLNVNKGDVIKVYHADPVGKNLFMENELIKDYTIGSNYAYYEVTDRGLEAILAIQAESSPQEFVLGEDSSDIDGTKLVKSIMINGTPVASDQYTVTQMSEFDTSIAGEKNIRVRIDTKDKMVSKEIEVPYTVKWGESFLVKSKSGGSAGAFSLIDGKALAGTTSSSKVLKISAGLDTPLDEKINADNEPNTYYSIEITRNGSSIYSQNMPGRATLQQIMNNFGNGSNLVTVQTGDIITVNQPQKIEGSSVLWQDETEKDYTYGSNTARYQVTDYGLEPAPELGGTTANKQLNLTEQPENVELNQLLSAVTVNGHAVTDDLYTIKQLTDFDTKTIGKREVKLQIDLKDGYATKEVDIPYEVKWGDSLVMKGLNGATVGVYSFIKKNDQWYLSATQGDPDADLNNWVNNEFGRNDYYRIEVDEGENSLPVPSQPEVFEDSSVNTGNFVYSVTGNMTFGQAIARFNNGQPLPISTGAIIKVYHAEPSKNNLFIQDDVVRDYTAGLNYAYYRVTDSGIEPITDMKANFVKMSLTLGEDATAKDIKALIQNVKFNDQELNTDLYTVEPVDTFDTSTVGEKELKVKLTTSDEVTTKEVAVPYTVNWGNTLVMKNKDGDTISAFSLTKEDKKLQIASLPGKNKSNLSKRITNADDSDVYYSIEVFSHNASQYKYEVHGKQTIEQAISRFNGGEPLTVSAGDQVKVYHADPSGNVFMSDEQEGNYTYGSNYAYYNVTDYGFEPTGDLSVTPAEPNITVGTKEVDLKDLLKEVKV